MSLYQPWFYDGATKLSLKYLDCSTDIIIAIDGSSTYRPFWSTVIRQSKAILRGLEHIEEIDFGMGIEKSKIIIQRYPKEGPSLSFEDYNHGK